LAVVFSKLHSNIKIIIVWQGVEKVLFHSLPPLEKGDKGGFLVLKSLSISLYERERKCVEPLFRQPVRI
jgi:hypothetical protein